jgi:DNA-binding response OmpR family regulator
MPGFTILVVESNPAFAATINYFASEIKSVAACHWSKSIVRGIVEANRVQPDLILIDQGLIEAYALGLKRGVWATSKAPKLAVMAGIDSLSCLCKTRLACADAYLCREELPSLLPALVHWASASNRSNVIGRSHNRQATSRPREDMMLAA